MDRLTRLFRALGAIVLTLFFTVIFLLLFNEAMMRGLGHDEHQFVVSGRLLADHGLLPYRDYPYFHMPYLAFLYALVFQVSDTSLLAARVVSVASASASLGLVAYLLHQGLRGTQAVIRWGVPAAGVLLLLTNPVFTYTSGQAWNHDVGTFLMLLAYLGYSRAQGPPQHGRRYLFSGVCLGLAIGVRLSFLVAGLALGAWMAWRFIRSGPARRSWRPMMGMAAGAGLALTPAAGLFLLAPQAFVFGNLVYPGLNTRFRLETGFRGRMDWQGKLAYLARDVLLEPGTLALVLAAGVLFGLALASRRPGLPVGGEPGLALQLSAALVVAAWLPTPTWLQYYFAAVPFLVISAGVAISRLTFRPRILIPAAGLWFLAAGVAVTVGLESYPPLGSLLHPDRWATLQVHRAGLELAGRTAGGRILTLAPIYPVEGGRPVYPALATGPFAWRTASLVGESERVRLGLIAPADLGRILASDPPAGVLVGPEGDLERPLRVYARDRGYRPLSLAPGLELLVPP